MRRRNGADDGEGVGLRRHRLAARRRRADEETGDIRSGEFSSGGERRQAVHPPRRARTGGERRAEQNCFSKLKIRDHARDTF